MTWNTALKKAKSVEKKKADTAPTKRIPLVMHKPDLSRIVTLDFETYYDGDYTLRKLNTSEYIRDERFKAHMVGIKIGKNKTKVIPGAKIGSALRAIPWGLYGLLCHNTAFDGFILSHHYGVVPRFYYDTLSMARGLHKNDIGASLDEVARFYGKGNKLLDVLDKAKGVADLKTAGLYDDMAAYCGVDVDLTFEIFQEMVKQFPEDEIQLIDRTIRMFTTPKLLVDIPRVQVELERELKEKEQLMLSFVGTETIIKRRLRDGATTDELKEEVRKKIASNASFAEMLKAAGVVPPVKISPVWLKKPERERDEAKKWVFAFSKGDEDFVALKEHPNPKVRALVEARLSVKSTISETRAERFLKAGANGMKLPVLLNYYGAHTGRWSAGNKMNMQNLPRGGELRKAILAPPGYVIVVSDSGQIEARTNAWLWDEKKLLDAFRKSDEYERKQALLPKDQRKPARGDDRDAYCKFADAIYKIEITKDQHEQERFVGKVGVLGLGYQMGANKLQTTLKLGIMGPPVNFSLQKCQEIVSAYRRTNSNIANGWQLCEGIIADMAAGREGSWKCLHWEKERIWLPNGMALKYPGLHSAKKLAEVKARVTDKHVEYNEIGEGWTYIRKGKPAKIYGGLLCENLVQALARIIVAQQLLVISERVPIVMFSHDENVALAKEREKDKVGALMLKAMQTPLPWCKDIPLNAEVKIATNYSK